MTDKTIFTPGDVVQLKSGGPTMTLYNVYQNETAADAFYADHRGQVREIIGLQTSVLMLAPIGHKPATIAESL